MALQKRLILFLMLSMSSISCYNCWQFDISNFYKIKNDMSKEQVVDDWKECEGDTPSSPIITFNVDDFGAKGDGSDATQAFLMAWEKACSSGGAIFVPNKNYLLNPIKFEGPCKSPITMQIMGTLLASTDRSAYSDRHWIIFDGVQNLLIEGSGIINGNGNIWWKNSCKVDKSKPCKGAPTAVTFRHCDDMIVRDIKVQDAQQMHMTFQGCNNVQASGLTITAPGESPNTDGIHITHTQNINVTDTIIGTGDDCISIESGSQNVVATGITCGPGHGISIGSLGDDQSEALVRGVTVRGAKFCGASNGVRIKTYQGGSGTASNIVFQDINMDNVENPIIIDQYYCDKDEPCKEQGTAVQVQNVLFQNITGTSASEVAIKLDCSKSYPCRDITLKDVELLSGEKAAKAECSNVKIHSDGIVNPECP